MYKNNSETNTSQDCEIPAFCDTSIKGYNLFNEKEPNGSEENELYQKIIKEAFKKHHLQEKEWSTIQDDINVFRNYFGNMLKLCIQDSLIFYYKIKTQGKTPSGKDYKKVLKADNRGKKNNKSTQNQGGQGVGLMPAKDAEYALFTLNVKRDEDNATLFACFKINNKEKKWKFHKIVPSTHPIWAPELKEITKVQSVPAILQKRINKRIYPKNLEDIDIINHLLDNYNRYLPQDISTFMNDITSKHKDYKEIINKIIRIFLYNGLRYKYDKTKFIPMCNIKESQLCLLYPFYLKGKLCGVFCFQTKKKAIALSTMLDLEMAYYDAKLFNPNFESTWLTIANVREGGKKD